MSHKESAVRVLQDGLRAAREAVEEESPEVVIEFDHPTKATEQREGLVEALELAIQALTE